MKPEHVRAVRSPGAFTVAANYPYYLDKIQLPIAHFDARSMQILFISLTQMVSGML